jgi:hypothetical protein
MKVRSVTCLALLLAITALALSCLGVKGDFGFKRFGDDTYRRIEGTPEFSSDETVDWVFKLSKKYSDREIGIVLQKKELVWVEISTRSQRITEASEALYGTIRDLQPGEYRLVLTLVKKDNELVDSKDFIIYEKEESADQD